MEFFELLGKIVAGAAFAVVLGLIAGRVIAWGAEDQP